MVSLGIASVLLVAFLTIIIKTEGVARLTVDMLRAEFYLTEAVEAAKDLERSNWSALTAAAGTCSIATPCHLEPLSGAWQIIPGSETLDAGYYTREFIVDAVCRDASTNDIADCSAGIPDPDTKKISAAVSWTDSIGPHNRDIEAYVYTYAP